MWLLEAQRSLLDEQQVVAAASKKVVPLIQKLLGIVLLAVVAFAGFLLYGDLRDRRMEDMLKKLITAHLSEAPGQPARSLSKLAREINVSPQDAIIAVTRGARSSDHLTRARAALLSGDTEVVRQATDEIFNSKAATVDIGHLREAHLLRADAESNAQKFRDASTHFIAAAMISGTSTEDSLWLKLAVTLLLETDGDPDINHLRTAVWSMVNAAMANPEVMDVFTVLSPFLTSAAVDAEESGRIEDAHQLITSLLKQSASGILKGSLGQEYADKLKRVSGDVSDRETLAVIFEAVLESPHSYVNIMPEASVVAAETVCKILDYLNETQSKLPIAWMVMLKTERTFPPGHQMTLDATELLGGVLNDVRLYSEAEICFQRVLDLRREDQNVDLSDISRTLYDLADVQESLDKFRYVAKNITESATIDMGEDGELVTDHALTLPILGRALRKMKQPELASLCFHLAVVAESSADNSRIEMRTSLSEASLCLFETRNIQGSQPSYRRGQIEADPLILQGIAALKLERAI